MLRLLAVLLRVLASAARSRCALLVENLALRQQLATVLASGARPRIRPADRAFWLLLRRVWARSVDVLVIVKPDTVARWQLGRTSHPLARAQGLPRNLGGLDVSGVGRERSRERK